jgi:hypothetical protein
MMPFYTKNDLHFTKTGSGQTYGKITKNMLFLTVRLRSIQVRKQERKKENKLGFSSAQNNCPLLSQVDLPRQTRDRAQSEGIDTEHAVVVVVVVVVVVLTGVPGCGDNMNIINNTYQAVSNDPREGYARTPGENEPSFPFPATYDAFLYYR